MCGIAGIFLKKSADRAYVDTATDIMQKAIFHRGPDSFGAHVEDDRAFLNRRLAIVGIAGGEQPIYGADKKAGIVYNGEVYNYRELREDLRGKGHAFATHTDTEVVLKNYLEKGVDSFADLEGMFGLCIWDERSDEIVLARDSFGMKPLYLYEDAEKFVFASELNAILEVPGVDASLSADGLQSYLTFRYCVGGHTLFRNIRRIEPGTYVKLSRKGAYHFSFSDLSELRPEPFAGTYEEAKEELHALLLKSVKMHLIGEVPIALLLSGGVDSSVLAGILHELGTNMECFNIGFDEVNEFEFSTAVADKYGFKMHNIELSAAAMESEFEAIVSGLDEPIADPAQIPLHILSREVKKSATVVLSGEGADELFCGYPQYWRCRDEISHSASLPTYLKNSYYFLNNNQYLKQPGGNGLWPTTRKYFAGSTTFGAMSKYDFKTWVPDNLMMKADKIAMKHSLEGRFPFLNREIMNFAQSLPTEFLLGQDGTSKRLLKDTFERLLPSKVLKRPKMGFTVPTGTLLKHFKDLYLDSISMLRDTEVDEFLELQKIEDSFTSFLNGRDDFALRCWTTMILCVWLAGKKRSQTSFGQDRAIAS
ncbi:asparagine synthase (glutamine-hydrolyzing) [Kordiimonas aestuarii]|uniref:asparagine synthase (glutamine-hydrolyzing) n=1 Tax=Kordiimonas aestuarii TaxID=1005925 RepID=UPI0021D318BE|nr:asparagine synthase (glutamine-hydrolyzing) [Kordiimonas aestuarii]